MVPTKREIEQLERSLSDNAQAINGAQLVVDEATRRTDRAFEKLDRNTEIIQRKVTSVRSAI